MQIMDILTQEETKNEDLLSPSHKQIEYTDHNGKVLYAIVDIFKGEKIVKDSIYPITVVEDKTKNRKLYKATIIDPKSNKSRNAFFDENGEEKNIRCSYCQTMPYPFNLQSRSCPKDCPINC